MAHQEPYITELPWGRVVVVVGPDTSRCRLRRPRCELPCIGTIGANRLFDLPSPDSRTHRVHVEFFDADGKHTGDIGLGCSPGLARPVRDDDDLSDEQPTRTPLDAVDDLVESHIERCQEIIFPSRKLIESGARRVQGLTRVGWDQMRAVYWQQDDREGPLRLIVRIADECSSLLQAVCEQPRRVLRRVRERVRIDRVQQMDDACIRWFVRQPGRSILEKAGPRRRVLSVQRVETADTLENRVVRDFIARALRSSTKYLREHGHRTHSQRVLTVRRFRSRLIKWMKCSEIGRVPALVGVPSPNYVLQFDVRYAPLWFWYDRLRRQQQGAEDAWRWRNGVFAEHGYVALSEALSSKEARPVIEKRLYLRTDHDRGRFVDHRSLAGMWNAKPGSAAERIVMLRNAEFQGPAKGIVPPWIMATGADIVIGRWDAIDGDLSSCLVAYCLLANDDGELRLARDAAMRIAQHLDSEGIPIRVSVLTIILNGAVDPEAAMCHKSTSTSARRIAVVELRGTDASIVSSVATALSYCQVCPTG